MNAINLWPAAGVGTEYSVLSTREPAEPPPGGYNPFGMNVIVFALRGCPVSALGPYGNEWIATPNLDRLAAEGVVFDRHVSDCPDPTAAGRAWRTGRHQVPPLPPSPLEGGGPGRRGTASTPHPDPPPQGGREQDSNESIGLQWFQVRWL